MMVRWILFGSLRNSAGRSLLGSNETENSLKDSADFDDRIARAPERP